MLQSTQQIHDNELSLTQNGIAKWNDRLKTMKKCYKDLVQQLHEKSVMIPLKKWMKVEEKNVWQITQNNYGNGSSMT